MKVGVNLLLQRKSDNQWHEDDLRTIENYRPLDDDFMRELFRDKGATPQRARYHSSAIDVEFLKAKEKFEELPVSYVIFITENDVRGENKLIYNFEWTDTVTGKPLNDGAHIIFVNGAYNNADDTSDLANLVHDFRCKRAEDMRIKELADKTRYFKETQEGVSIMCKAIEEMRNEVTKEAEKLRSYQIAINLIAMKTMSDEAIAQATDLTLEEVSELKTQNSAGIA